MTEAARGCEVEDFLRLKSVSDAQVSPDGSRVAFVVSEIDVESDGYTTAIWSVAAAGEAPTRLTTAGRNNSQPRWSPDGRWLAFVSARDGKAPQLQLLALSGGEARRLTDLARGVNEIAWSSDSTTIAFTSATCGPDSASTSASIKEGAAPPRVVSNLKHKFNGQGFFDGSRRHVFTVGLSGEPPRQLTDGDWDDGEIAWAPDGREIAFVSARHEGRDRDTGHDLWVVPAAGGEPRQLTQRFGHCQAPAFSPDGTLIAFAGHTDAEDVGGRTAFIWLMPAAGGTPRNLTSALDRSIQAGAMAPGAPPARLHWSPDGGSIIARVHDGSAVHLYRFDAATGHADLLAGGRRVVESFSVARDGAVAASIADHTHPAEAFLIGADGHERRLTGINDELCAGLRFPTIEPLSVTLADGAIMDGWVIKPPNMEPGQQYPLVLDVHGGPHGAFQYNFRLSYPFLLAAQGCAVLQMNPRGSTGWGEEFARFLHGGRGERDLPELLAAVDHVLAQGWVDPARLGVTGYSYGGYMTAWAISQTDRFKAAVWGAGTANLYTHFAYSDMNVPRYKEMGGSPWERRELYLRQSPISYVHNIRTPLLMLHGEADLRCNIAQADEFFTALKYFGVEAVLVRYPGENHGMRMQGKPSNRLDYDRRLLAWFGERLTLSPASVARQPVTV